MNLLHGFILEIIEYSSENYNDVRHKYVKGRRKLFFDTYGDMKSYIEHLQDPNEFCWQYDIEFNAYEGSMQKIEL